MSDADANAGAGAAAEAAADGEGVMGRLTVEQFVDRLSSADPTPGGGAAAAMIGATAAGLVSMVAELSTNPKLDPYRRTIDRSRQVGREMGLELLRLADEDAQAFEAFMAAWRSTKGMEPAARRDVLSAAGRVSLEPPRAILACCRVIADAGERLAGRSNLNLVSDLLCASRAVEAAAHCAAENVFVNLANVTDRAEAEALRAETKRMVADVERLARSTRRAGTAGVLRTPQRRTTVEGGQPDAT